LQIKTKIVGCHTADSKQVKQEVNCTVIFPPLVFPGVSIAGSHLRSSPIFVDQTGDCKGDSTVKKGCLPCLQTLDLDRDE